jgi:hypothetical protein
MENRTDSEIIDMILGLTPQYTLFMLQRQSRETLVSLMEDLINAKKESKRSCFI